MSQPPSLTPDPAALEFPKKRSTMGAADQARPGTSDLAIVPLADLFQRLHSTDAGLSASDAAAILETVGPNQVDTAKKNSLLADFAARFSNPLVLIPLFAAAVSAFTGEVLSSSYRDIVLMSVILDVTQERQAQNAAERLREQVSLSANRYARKPGGHSRGADRARRCRSSCRRRSRPRGFSTDRSPRPLR